MNYDLIIRNVKELNIIAGEGESKIEKTKDGARLKVLHFVFPLSTCLCFFGQKPISFFQRRKFSTCLLKKIGWLVTLRIFLLSREIDQSVMWSLPRSCRPHQDEIPPSASPNGTTTKPAGLFYALFL